MPRKQIGNLAMKCPACQTVNSADSKYCKSCAMPLPVEKDRVSFTETLESPHEELARGTVFSGRYEIIEELGEGGMGRVYRAFDKKLDEEIALKFLKPEIAANRRTVERFRNEIKVARKITHPNVCRTHDLGEEGRILFITMEYVRGEDLKSLIRRTGQLTAGKAISIARQVALGLTQAHNLGVIHRDLKPSNIMIDKDGNAKIMDFGIARSLEGRGTTAEGAVIGTLEYMSPEQVDGTLADQRADIYALGVILFEMVTGRPPFEGETAFAVANKHKNEPAPDPREINPQLPAGLGRTILRCLEKDREARYQTAAELLADLEGVEASLPATERAAGRAPSRAKQATSKTITVRITPRKLLIPTVALVAIVTAFIIFWPEKEKRETAALPPSSGDSIAVLPFADLSPAKDQAANCEGFADTIRSALANVNNLQVRGKHSSLLVNAQDDPREVGRKLNVEKLFMGSLQILGDRIRIIVELVNVADGVLIWSSPFDGTMDDTFDIQDEITTTIVSKMDVSLTAEESKGLAKRYTNNKDAYALYLKAKYIGRSGAPDDAQKAVPIYLEAIEKDPHFVLPHIALARLYAYLYSAYGVLSREEAYDQSKEFASKAMSIDSDNGAAYAALANLNSQFENDLAAADRNYGRALLLSPRDLEVLEDHNFYLIQRGRLEEALEEIKLMTEIDPLLPQNYFYLGRQYYYLRRYEDSVAAYAKGLELDPGHVNSLTWRNFTYLAQGRHEKVLEAVQILEGIWPPGAGAWLAMNAASQGKRMEAERYKAEAMEVFKGSFNSAVYHAALGDRDAALSHLQTLYNGNRHEMSFCFLIHFFDKYRSDPEFVELMSESGFEFPKARKD